MGLEEVLETIRNLKQSYVRSLVESRLKEFEQNGRRTSNEIFKELCFCILAANFNAERSIRIQKEIRNGFLNLHATMLARKLRKLGHRFPNTRAKYIVQARKYKDSIKEIIRSYKNENALRKWLADNVMGIGYKEASLPDYEKVLVIIGGKVEPIRIGDLYRQHANGILNDTSLKTFSFNPETLKFEIAPITKVLKHKYKRDLYEIQLEWGKKISVTGDHSVFSIGSNGIFPIEVRALKTGDFIAVPRRYGTTNSIDYSGIIQPIQLENKTPVNKREVIPNTGQIIHQIFSESGFRTKIAGRQTALYRKVMRWKHVGHPSRMMLKEFLIEANEHGNCREIRRLEMIVNSDLSFARIRNIKRVPYQGDYVYDLEVAQKDKDFQNFIGGVGGVCLHNSHFLRNIGHNGFAILDFHMIDIMVRCGLIDEPRTLTKRRYLEIEDVLRMVAERSGLSLGELDLYLWYLETGRVLK